MWRLAAAIVLMLIGAGCQSAETPKPVVEEYVSFDAFAPPSTPALMFAEADAVVLAAYTGESGPALMSMAPDLLPPPFTIYTFETIETLKPGLALSNPGDRFDVMLPGGEREEETRMRRFRAYDMDVPQTGDTYLVFLQPFGSQRVAPAWGPAGLYDVSSGYVRSLSRKSTQHDGTATADFIERLHEAQ